MKSGNLNFLEPSGPLQACNGTVLPLHSLLKSIILYLTVEELESNLMLLFIKFYFTSSMLNMFRTLIHSSSGACDFSITTLVVCSCFDVCWSFGVAGLGWYPCGRLQPVPRIPPQPSHTETPTHIETRIHNQCGYTIEKSQAPDDGCISVRNMLSIEVK